MRVLVAYASKHGSTGGVAEAIVERLRALEVGAEACSVDDVEDLRGFDVVVLGSAIYAGSWIKGAVDFAERNRDTLEQLPVWLFSVGPLGEEVEDQEEQPKQLAALREELHPRGYRVFFGALDRAKLSFPERMMVKAVRAPEGDFRDWDEIGAWAGEIAGTLVGV
jgi:menaquinone-dependent protoporphyrinogen oxidase